MSCAVPGCPACCFDEALAARRAAEAERLAVDAYRASIARGIANGILIYTGKM